MDWSDSCFISDAKEQVSFVRPSDLDRSALGRPPAGGVVFGRIESKEIAGALVDYYRMSVADASGVQRSVALPSFELPDGPTIEGTWIGLMVAPLPADIAFPLVVTISRLDRPDCVWTVGHASRPLRSER